MWKLHFTDSRYGYLLCSKWILITLRSGSFFSFLYCGSNLKFKRFDIESLGNLQYMHNIGKDILLLSTSLIKVDHIKCL